MSLEAGTDEMGISLSSAAQCSLLWNSLGKPLVALLSTVVLCDIAGAGEAVTLCLAVCGFVVGVLRCSTLPESILEKISVN